MNKALDYHLVLLTLSTKNQRDAPIVGHRLAVEKMFSYSSPGRPIAGLTSLPPFAQAKPFFLHAAQDNNAILSIHNFTPNTH